MPRIPVTKALSIDADELVEKSARASGPGGQHVNTTNTAIELRFDVLNSTLPEAVRRRLMALAGSRLNQEGVIVLFAQGERSQEMNRRDVRERLFDLIREAAVVPKRRRPTKPSRAAKAKRVDSKKAKSRVKAMRGRVTD
jgi:ribosome-associated protein